ncbi:MAG: HD domain-containing protein [Candidatus Pacebacteria bacterium]|nr:HD domain-containing protein [Candidatus Paceibacterota bacterium]
MNFEFFDEYKLIINTIIMANKNIINFIFEMKQLSRIKHEGWRMIGIEDPESVADHSLRSAQIGFILAKLEEYENPCEVCSMIVFHDMAESRIGDVHRVANRYIEVEEEKVVEEQTRKLDEIGEEIFEMWKQAENRSTAAGIIARDANWLDMAFTAKAYMEIGYKYAKDWMNNIEKSLKTKSAKELFNELKRSDSNEWWQKLKKMKK